MDKHVAALTELYTSASPELREAGANWYPHAHEIARKISGGSVEQGAGVLAAISPMLNWEKSVVYATDIFEGGYPRILPENLVKALKIKGGHWPLDVLRGPKVRAFYLAIMLPYVSFGAVVDRHMVRAYDSVGGSTSLDAHGNLPQKNYDKIADAIRLTSLEVGAKLHETQATIWLVQRSKSSV